MLAGQFFLRFRQVVSVALFYFLDFSETIHLSSVSFYNSFQIHLVIRVSIDNFVTNKKTRLKHFNAFLMRD